MSWIKNTLQEVDVSTLQEVQYVWWCNYSLQFIPWCKPLLILKNRKLCANESIINLENNGRRLIWRREESALKHTTSSVRCGRCSSRCECAWLSKELVPQSTRLNFKKVFRTTLSAQIQSNTVPTAEELWLLFQFTRISQTGRGGSDLNNNYKSVWCSESQHWDNMEVTALYIRLCESLSSFGFEDCKRECKREDLH